MFTTTYMLVTLTMTVLGIGKVTMSEFWHIISWIVGQEQYCGHSDSAVTTKNCCTSDQ